MNDDPSLREKTSILYRNGLLRDQDRVDRRRVEARWRLYKTTPQKTFRGKEKPDRAAAE